MHLSEAIRLGALLKPQAFHGPSDSLIGEVATCALAAAAEAVGDPDLNLWRDWRTRWPTSLVIHRVVCPDCGSNGTAYESGSLVAVIAHLNDEHRWTRGRIADWVETCERLEFPVSADAVREDVAEPVVPLRE